MNEIMNPVADDGGSRTKKPEEKYKTKFEGENERISKAKKIRCLFPVAATVV